MRLRPPKATRTYTLFPYTPLFRSADAVRPHGLVETAAFDVADAPAAEAAIAAIGKTHGRLDILINNAGINIRKPLDAFTVDDWRQVLEVDLTAAFVLSRAVAPGMEIGRASRRERVRQNG